MHEQWEQEPTTVRYADGLLMLATRVKVRVVLEVRTRNQAAAAVVRKVN